jgi:4-aminobutyrate aminotransferase / (S)-3-amino-2-methylpropionate transaminase / 5-aminovalerate transaminase
MQPTDTSAAERILADRARYVAPGMSTPRLVVADAEGARLTDPDGRTYIDFAGGIGCQNTGHRHAAIVEAIKEQADRYLHQCFMVGIYEPYVEVCRRLAELSPCAGAEQKSLLVNSGAEAVENAVKIARWATGRQAVVAFDNAFHGRTLLAMTMTSKVRPYKAGFGPFAPEVYRAPAPYPYHGISSDDAIAALEHLFKADVDPSTVACVVLEPVQGEGGFVAMPSDYPARLQELCREHGILWVNDEVQSGTGRTGTMWAIEQYADAEPDMTVFGKSIGGGLPLAGVVGRAEVMDAVPPGGLGGTFGGNPLSCAAALAVLDVVTEPEFLAGARELGQTLRARIDARLRVHRADSGSREGGRGHRLRSRPDPALVRPLRQRDPFATPSQHRAGGVGRGVRHPGGVAWRLTPALWPLRTSASEVSRRGTATSSRSTASTSTSLSESSSRCSGPRGRARPRH